MGYKFIGSYMDSKLRATLLESNPNNWCIKLAREYILNQPLFNKRINLNAGIRYRYYWIYIDSFLFKTLIFESNKMLISIYINTSYLLPSVRPNYISQI